MSREQALKERRAQKLAEDMKNLKGFRRWRKTRPFYAGLFSMIGGGFIVSGPLSLMRFSFLPHNAGWEGLVVGGFILLFGILEWFAPYYALLTGLMTIVLSLVSLIVALGGLLIGMIFGLIGGALAVAWHPILVPEIGMQQSIVRVDNQNSISL